MDTLSCFQPVSVCEASGVIDYLPSRRYPLTLSEARRRAMRSIRIPRKASILTQERCQVFTDRGWNSGCSPVFPEPQSGLP